MYLCQQHDPSGTAVVGSPRRQGMTIDQAIIVLILIVFFIVTIFLFVFAPLQGTTKESARRQACLSNLRQMGAANLEYAQQNKDFIPRGGSRMHWAIPVAEQMKLVEEGQYEVVNDLPVGNFEIFRCPTGTRTRRTQFLDYVGNTLDAENGPDNDWQEISKPTKLNLWKHPGKVLYIGDAALESGTDAEGANMNGNLKRFRENRQLDRMSVYTPDQIQSSPNRHAGTRIHLDRFAGWVFADGHAENVDWKKGERTAQQWLRMYGVEVP
jgi:hypothetical protein